MQNILAAATNAGVTLPVTEIVSGIFADLLQHQPDADHSAAILALEQRNPAHRLGDCKSRLP
jgi:2-hydroxy-3-oxopropionate reductase